MACDTQCCVHTRQSHTRTSSSKAAVSSESDIPQITRILNSAFRKIHLPAVSRYSIFIDCGEIQRGLLDQSALDNVRNDVIAAVLLRVATETQMYDYRRERVFN